MPPPSAHGTERTETEVARASRDLAALVENIERVITGKRQVVELAADRSNVDHAG